MEKIRDISLKIYFVGLLCLAASLALGNFPISLSQFILAGAWLLNPDYKLKFRRLANNTPALLLMSVYGLHLLGLIHTSEDFNYALKDLRIKLPLLILPFIIGSLPQISKKQFKTLVNIFLASLIFTSFVCTLVRAGLFKQEINTIRDISIFISHIRYSLLICLGVFYSLYVVSRKGSSIKSKILMFIIAAWLTTFLFILQSPTGIGILFSCGLLSAAVAVWSSRKPVLKVAMVIILLGIPIYSFYTFHSVYNDLLVAVPVNENELEDFTPRGNKYTHHLSRPSTENGNRTWIYISWDELEKEWHKRSNTDFEAKDKRGNLIKYTLVRYLTSKGLRKDADGMMALSDKDIGKVESGVANVKREGLGNFTYRLYQLVWECRNYMEGGNPSGHSLAMRFEYWKASVEIIKKAPFIGVGTGDLPIAFDRYYEESNSPLGSNWRRRAHNQFLSIAATFGTLGLLWFLFCLFYPGFALDKFNSYHYLIFFVIAFLSMLTEDTIESQVGVSFFAYFNSLLLLGISSEEEG